MAWRELGKRGLCASLTTDLTARLRRHAVGFTSVSTVEDVIKSVSAASRCVPDPSFRFMSTKLDCCEGLTKDSLIRCYHASPEPFARKGNEDSFGLKTPKKGKFKRRDHKAHPPVEAPYVPPKPQRTTKSMPDKIEIFEGMTVVKLAKRTGESIPTLQSILTKFGEKVDTEFDPLSIDVSELIAMGTEIVPRPPVVTVMGHVDHGKTSLLDALRQTSVASKEAGGITQHLGAFVVGMTSGASITFLDTPGHAAFSAMRARGAAVTDIVVLVVAADDGVMPQTLEAMAHAKAANVPIVVAINKCDKPAANPERIKLQLASEGLLLEEMGGDVQVVQVSVLKKTGLDNLKEALLLQAEIMDLKSRVDGPAQAYVVEARVDKGKGPAVTAIMKAGTLESRQYVVVGSEWGRIRAIRGTAGKLAEKARPAMPVEIEGLKGLPRAGDDIIVVESEERARMLTAGRKKKFERDRVRKIKAEMDVRNGEEMLKPKKEEPKQVELPIIVKADVQGTVQAVTDALVNLNSPQIMLHSVIYHLLEDIGNFMVDKAPGTYETKVAGEAEVLSIFELKGRSKTKGPDVKN
ncbi:translation initiation factor IF-2 [Pyrus ussuriensis x Pyrus communis]|uniref:Translation initiation factor IF-2 n=1 Tax=Pyrus ussuriensis x Pyrus communis TaxID=2448454 RepID=A0A5N5G0A7_9ROSA|nr:translation initiation factor IF-2 [Pyrus ussuriensis x Pyrus communis]